MLTLTLLLACTRSESVDPVPFESPLWDIEPEQTWSLDGLETEATVVFTEMGVPHIYAESEADLYRVQGFLFARDRFFMLDLVRRLATGTVSGLMGDVVLDVDIESRMIGMTQVTDSILEAASGDPRMAENLDAYAAGVNAYIDAVGENRLPAPAELELAAPLLGFESAHAAMEPYDRRSVAAIGGAIMFRLGYETSDPSQDRDWHRSADHFAGAALEGLRTAALFEDVWGSISPVYDVSSSAGWGNDGQRRSAGSAPPMPGPRQVPDSLTDRLDQRLQRIEDRIGRPRMQSFGSNAWAVAGGKSADGRAMLSGDGHLELDIPALLWQVSQDTAHLGGGEIHTSGMVIAGIPFLSLGTNGKIAFTTTQLSGDVTDWYAEQIRLDASGQPSESLTPDGWQPLVPIEERYEVRGVALLDSEERTEVWTRYVTAGGRWITGIEGREVSADDALGAGETRVNLLGDLVVPSDTDDDGVITAISFDYSGLDGGTLFQLFDTLVRAETVADVHEATKKALAISQNLMAADTAGDIYYSGYQMVPCRGYLPRDQSGMWLEGAHPQRLLDGTTYPGFTIPVSDDGSVDESQATDPERCVVPHEEVPHAFSPDKGYLVTANNDIGGITFDDDLTNEPWYIGGPWDVGYRAEAIDRLLAEATADGQATPGDMAAIQGHRTSALGVQFQPFLLEVLARAAVLEAPTNPAEARVRDLYEENRVRFDEVFDRLSGWRDRGYQARSGVETFYNPLLDDDPDDAVATMIHNTWMGDLKREAIDDEGIPGRAFQRSGGDLKLLSLMVEGRGADNPLGLAGFNPETGESVFWDHLGTPDIVETSDEIALQALAASLDFLASDPTGPDEGGFGTEEMAQWTWGLRHQAEFRSLVGAYIDDPLFASLLTPFSVTTDVLDLQSSDSRAGALTWFPRHGDKRGIDAANNSMSGRSFRYGNGPVDRITIQLSEDAVDGYMVLPGGQSGLPDSPHFADQAALWLANEALPLRHSVEQVVEGAESRWVFTP